jgi:hypothetical protein
VPTLRIRLIHWNTTEAEEKAAHLLALLREREQAADYGVDAGPLDHDAMLKLRQNPPDVLIIDLTRLPSQGRDIALNLRQFKAMRSVPIVFAGGEAAKLARIKALLPDAIYSTWDEIDRAIQQALANPPAVASAPQSSFAAYAGVPLVKKLGVKTNAVVGLVGAPTDFVQNLGDAPEGIVWRSDANTPCDLILWFLTSRQELESQMAQVRPNVGKDGLWIIWPKRGSSIASDLTQAVVRQVGLAAGLVDYKISAIDATWSGLRFAVRRAK